MTTPLAQINKLLPLLNANELEQLAARARSLASLGDGQLDVPKNLPVAADNPRQEEDEVDENFVLSCISLTMQNMGVDMTSAGMLRKTREFAAFREKVPPLMRFVRRASSTRQTQVAILQLGVRMLHHEIRNMGFTVSSRVIMRQLHRLPAAINHQFPGYAGAGRLEWIMHKLLKRSLRDAS